MNQDERINSFVTKISNNKGITKKQKEFLKKCTWINLVQQRSFSSSDFPEITPNNFRQRVYRLNEYIEVYVKSSVCYYRIKGVPLSRNEIVTEHPMGDKMLWMLQTTKEQPAAIHNIKIQLDSNLHSIIAHTQNINMDSKNKAIILNCELSPKYNTKLLIYPKTIQISIACTYNPIIYNSEGAFFLNSLLTLLHQYLVNRGDNIAVIPHFNDWMITHYHFGKDGKEEWNGESFQITVRDALDGVIRYYGKLMPNKKRICRLEEIKTPRISISEELEKMLESKEDVKFVN